MQLRSHLFHFDKSVKEALSRPRSTPLSRSKRLSRKSSSSLMTRRTLRNVHRWWSELWRWVGAGGAWVIHSESSAEYSGCPSTRNSELLDSSPRPGIHLTVDSRSGKRFMGA